MKRQREIESDEDESSENESKSYNVTLHIGNNAEAPEEAPADDAATPEEVPEEAPGEDEFQMSESEKSSTESEEYSDHYSRKSLRGFVVNDSDDGEDFPRRRRREKVYHALPTRSSRRLAGGRSAGRRAAPTYGSTRREPSEEDELKAELRAELRDLRSPSPVMRELRTRERVNYRILPPPPAEPRYSKGESRAKRPGDRRLYSVAGPFGGNDITTLFKPRRHEMEKLLKELGEPTSSSTTIVSSATQLADSDPLGIETNIDFTSIGGLEDYIDQLKEMVTLPLMYPELYKRFGITPPRGVLFHGPPGTGKTLMARALAAMGSKDGRKITFFMRKGGDSLSKWVGEAERQLRVLFDEAKEKQPSIIFFDEIDGLAPVRSSKQDQIHASIVSTLLALMDGLDNRGQVVVIGATNRPDNIDPALRRPGRFDREFFFPLPNFEARQQIIRIHTKKWSPPLEDRFIAQVADLTKGYGGADLKALCTESALNAIQRSYPQIYASEKKLVVVPESIAVNAQDVFKGLERILPSTARGTNSASKAPLPARVLPLLEPSFEAIKGRLSLLLPTQKRLTALEVASYETNASFEVQQRLDDFKAARINRPRLLVHGLPGNGQEYIGSAILSELEGITSHVLDLAMLFSDSMRTPEAAIVQTLVEARKHAPSVVLIPNIELWFATISAQAQGIFFNFVRSFAPTEKVLIVGVANAPRQELDEDIQDFFGHSVALTTDTSPEAMVRFFGPLLDFVEASPLVTMDLQDREKRVLPELPVADVDTAQLAKEATVHTAQQDNRTRSQLKVKLGSLMDMFQKRYRRFKKPVVDDEELVYLFEPDFSDEDRPYVRTEDDMIMEVTTGKKYYNIDLDVVEDRLWNGYYCEPRQFLQDLELIHEDSLVLGDRDRIHKSSEMVANAQVALDDIDSTFIEACRDLRKREAQKRLKELEDEERLVEVDDEVAEVVPESQYDQVPEVPESEPEPQPNGHAEVSDAVMDVSEPLEPKQVAQPTPESQPVQEPAQPAEPTPTVTVPPHELEALKQKLASFQHKSLDKLENIFSALVDTAWTYRLDWDRTAMISALLDLIDDLNMN